MRNPVITKFLTCCLHLVPERKIVAEWFLLPHRLVLNLFDAAGAE